MTAARDRIEPYLEFVRQRDEEGDPAHDVRHVERIVRRLGMLAEGMSPPPRPHLLNFLAAFHRQGERVDSDATFRQEALGLLHGLGWTEAEAREALAARKRHLSDPQSVEEQIVHDANYLELLGAFGIAKAFTTGGARGQSCEETVEIYEGDYLDRVDFRTPVGRKLATEGRAYAKRFLERLRREW